MVILKIKEYREEAQLTQKQLAEKVTNLQRNVSNWENGISEPDLQTVVRLADCFDVTLDELFGRTPSVREPSETDEKLTALIKRLDPMRKKALLEMLEAFS